MKFLPLFIPLFFVACSDNSALTTQEEEKKMIDKLKTEIVALVENSNCSEEYTCKFVGLGSKPCGGHWKYLLYSSAVDTIKLLTKVEDCNRLENDFNQKWGVISDCSFVMPPESVICEDGKCKAVYSN
jgi:hypothetical protein